MPAVSNIRVRTSIGGRGESTVFADSECIGAFDPPGVVEDGRVGIGEHHDTVARVLSQAKGTGDLVAMRRTLVEAIDGPDGDALALQMAEWFRVEGADHLDDQVRRIHSSHLGETGIPPQRFKVESGLLVDDAGDAPASRGRTPLPPPRLPSEFIASVPPVTSAAQATAVAEQTSKRRAPAW